MTQTTHTAPYLSTLELLFQPEVDLASGAVVAMEGVVRGHRGDTPAVGDWVLATGAAEVAAWRDLRGGARQLWLNASHHQLRHTTAARRRRRDHAARRRPITAGPPRGRPGRHQLMTTTTPLHDKVWIASQLDDDRGKLYRAECACGVDNPWHDDAAQALANARTHRADNSERDGTTAA